MLASPEQGKFSERIDYSNTYFEQVYLNDVFRPMTSYYNVSLLMFQMLVFDWIQNLPPDTCRSGATISTVKKNTITYYQKSINSVHCLLFPLLRCKTYDVA